MLGESHHSMLRIGALSFDLIHKEQFGNLSGEPKKEFPKMR
jgi:hypothetical protein